MLHTLLFIVSLCIGLINSVTCLHFDILQPTQQVTYTKQQADENLQELQALIRLQPDNIHLLLYLGLTYKQLNNTDDAKKTFTDLLTKNVSAYDQFVAHWYLAEIAHNEHNTSQALEHYLLAFSKQPQNVTPLIRSSELYIHSNAHPICYFLTKQAADITQLPDATPLSVDNTLTLYDILSVSSWHMRDYNRGLSAITTAIAQSPHENTHFAQLAALYIKHKNQQTKNTRQLRVIQLQPNLGGISGVEQHLAIFNKMLYQKGIYSQIITSKGATFLVNKVATPDHAYGLPCITYQHNDYMCRPSDIILADPSIIICSSLEQIETAMRVQAYIQPKIIYVNHNSRWEYNDAEIALINHADAIITVHFSEAEIFRALHKQGKIKTSCIEQIPPCADDEKFLSFQPQRSKQEFLQQRFGLTIPNEMPIISCIANFYWFKNHGLLIQALGILKNQKNKQFHALLAGHGPDLPRHKQTAHELGLDNCVHFIGLTHETPELLYHSDCHVLASYDESFGLVHVEAALMKKPFVAARTTGITQYIKPYENGLIFINQDAQNLADTLAYLIDNPEQTKTMGNNAYNYARNHLTTDAIFEQWQRVFNTLMR